MSPAERSDHHEHVHGVPALTPVHWLSVRELLARFRSGELRPSDCLTALLARIEAHNGPINCIVDLQAESALARACEADAAYAAGAEAGRDLPPLLGIPFLVKEQHDIAGLSASRGSQTRAGVVAQQDAEIVTRLMAAGAIPFGRTTTPEMSCATFTHTRQWGVTGNPYNPERSPGGSSGGSAAAVAAGFAPLATSSDIGGSTRLPAAFCGLPGLKTSYGRTPGATPTNIDWYRGDHVLTRTVADTALVFNQIIGPSETDLATAPATAPLPVEFPASEAPLAGLRVALSPDLGCYALDPAVAAGVERAAAALADAGAEIIPVDVGLSLKDVTTASMTHYGHLLAANMRRQSGGDITALEPYAQQFLALTGRYAAEHSLIDAAALEADIQRTLMASLAGADVLLTATSAVEDLPADADVTHGITRPDGVHECYWEAHLAVPFNIANRLAVMSMPSGLGSSGVPTGVQIAARPYREDLVLRVAAALEERVRVPRPKL